MHISRVDRQIIRQRKDQSTHLPRSFIGCELEVRERIFARLWHTLAHHVPGQINRTHIHITDDKSQAQQ